MDETGLYFKALPDRTLTHKMEECRGGKRAMERLTLSLCCSLMGEKDKPILIGKSYRPRCFKHLDVEKLPVTWRSNKSAWMTSPTFEDWLKKFNSLMKSQKRKILLFLDNATCHSDLTLSNIKLQFLPPNTTSMLQPLDLGVIKAVKSRYRKRLLQHLISLMDSSESATELSRKLNVLDAAYWIAKAWDETSPTTIQKCFKACVFSSIGSEQQTREHDDTNSGPDEETEALLTQVGRHLEVASWQQFVSIDDDVATHDTPEGDWEDRLLTSYQGEATATAVAGDEGCDDGDGDNTTQEVSFAEILQTLTVQREYAIQTGDADVLDHVMYLRDRLVMNSRHQKRAMITDLFSPSHADHQGSNSA